MTEKCFFSFRVSRHVDIYLCYWKGISHCAREHTLKTNQPSADWQVTCVAVFVSMIYIDVITQIRYSRKLSEICALKKMLKTKKGPWKTIKKDHQNIHWKTIKKGTMKTITLLPFFHGPFFECRHAVLPVARFLAKFRTCNVFCWETSFIRWWSGDQIGARAGFLVGRF